MFPCGVRGEGPAASEEEMLTDSESRAVTESKSWTTQSLVLEDAKPQAPFSRWDSDELCSSQTGRDWVELNNPGRFWVGPV
jgi:hypothetical protein